MKKQPLHFLRFYIIGGAIAVASYVAFGAKIEPGSRENFLINLWFLFFPWTLIVLMIITFKSEYPLSYKFKLLISSGLVFLILLLVGILNIYNIHHRRMGIEDILIGIQRTALFGAFQIIVVAGLVFLPSRISRKQI